MKPGDIAFLVESNRAVREVTIVRHSGGLYLIRFNDTGGGIQVKEHRLFATREEAEQSLPESIRPKPNHGGYKSPYDYE